MTTPELICFHATIEHDTHVRDALLLIFIRIQRISVTRAGAPVNRMRRITGLIFAYTEEFCPCTTCARGDCPRVDAGSARPEGNVADAHHRWEDEQSSLRFN